LKRIIANYVKESEKSKILLPDNNRDKNYQNLCLDSNNRFPISHTNGSSYLTFQEFSCIKLKAEGLTYKEIAKKLGLSHRSVETYFYRAKERTKCSIAKLEKLLLS
jgi:DNA-binding CsgD family transcriptional regulator